MAAPDSTRTPRGRLALGALAGLLGAGAGVLLAELVSALLSGVTSPLLSVGNRFVDWTPQPLKDFAIETFGEADKAVLIGGMVLVVSLLAMVAGVIGVRRPRVAAGAFVLLVLVAGAASVTDRVAAAGALTRLVPVVVMLVVGLAALLLLLGLLRKPATDAASESPAPGVPAPGPASGRATDLSTEAKPRLLLERALPARVEGDELPAGFDRRAFLIAASAVTAVAAGGGLASRALGGAAAADRAAVTLPPSTDSIPLPSGAELDVRGITSYLTPNADFYRVDTALQVPQVPIDGWSLRIHGMVDEEVTLTFEDLLAMPLIERRITMTCVSNPVGGPLLGNATWLGVRTRDLLAMAGVSADADAVLSTSVDGMTIGTPLEALTDDREAMIAIGMNGEPLPLDHGFPVRMVTPGIYGYVGSTKWLAELEVSRFEDFEAYWTPRGYDEEAPIKMSSRIDVPAAFERVPTGTVVVAGVAWAQTVGIRSVEVRIDDGAWEQAELAAFDNRNTWRQWRYEWDARDAGGHTITVRMTDENGDQQVEERQGVAPNGSTGWHNIRVTVEG